MVVKALSLSFTHKSKCILSICFSKLYANGLMVDKSRQIL
ncbi:Uncharacterised protein [Streptobacillus moniliformis]|nr:Uncharacterised protein [Streptobacillus moniliformis]